MGVSARLAPGRPAPKSNQPSAPAELFRKKKGERAGETNKEAKTGKSGSVKQSPEKLTAEDYIDSKRETSIQDLPAMQDDERAAVIASLEGKYRRLFEAIPAERAVPLDALARLGYSIGEVMSAMTMLEVKGLVSSLSGGLYIRR